jgi:hypothetical protein
MTAHVLAAAALAAAALATPAVADPANGCTVTSGQSCSFTAGGDVRYVAAGLGGCTIEIIRDWTTVYVFSGNLPPTDVIAARPGDRVEVYAGFASNPAFHTLCDVRDAQ